MKLNKNSPFLLKSAMVGMAVLMSSVTYAEGGMAQEMAEGHLSAQIRQKVNFWICSRRN
jgi:hypothetical protein